MPLKVYNQAARVSPFNSLTATVRKLKLALMTMHNPKAQSGSGIEGFKRIHTERVSQRSHEESSKLRSVVCKNMLDTYWALIIHSIRVRSKQN